MLNRFGFAERWIQWVMMCVSSVNYSIFVKADSVGPIQPGRGLRQGDPLSPYLFILISEGLFALIKGVMARSGIHGVKISDEGNNTTICLCSCYLRQKKIYPSNVFGDKHLILIFKFY